MTIIAFNRYWVIRWHWLLLSLLAMSLLLFLSLWQVSRANEKQQILARIQQWQLQGAVSIARLIELDSQPIDGLQMQFSARWVEPYVWLLDNQLLNGRSGYDVIIAVEAIADLVHSPQLHVERQQKNPALLVNLGWLPAPPQRAQLPLVIIPPQLQVQGILRTKTKGLLLGANLEDKGVWPMRIQQLDAAELAQFVPGLLSQGILFQQGPSPFELHYQPVTLPPERHRAYAVQWALLALAVMVVALAASSHKELSNDQP